jgi:hypothetical protein
LRVINILTLNHLLPPSKLTNNIGRSEACFTRLAIIEVSTEFHLKIEDAIPFNYPLFHRGKDGKIQAMIYQEQLHYKSQP